MNAATKELPKLQKGAGLMWHDNEGKLGLTPAIKQGMEFFRSKYKVISNTCYVNHMEEAPKVVHGLKIKKVRWVRPNYYYFVVETTRQ